MTTDELRKRWGAAFAEAERAARDGRYGDVTAWLALAQEARLTAGSALCERAATNAGKPGTGQERGRTGSGGGGKKTKDDKPADDARMIPRGL